MEQSKINMKTLIPVLMLAVFQTSYTAFSSVLGTLSAVFPDASTTTIQLVLTVASSMSIPSSFLSGFLATYIPKKKIVLGAAGLIFIGGMIPLVAHASIQYLFMSSLCIGLGQGFMITTLGAMISELYDGNARASALGFRMVAANIGLTSILLLVGYLASTVWYHAYFVYFIVIPIVVIAAVFLPMGEKDQKLIGKGVGMTGFQNLAKSSYWILIVIMIGISATMFTFYTNIAMNVNQLGLGDSAVASRITSANTIIILCVGLLFGFIIRIFKKYTFGIAMLVMAAAFMVLSMATSVPALLAGGMMFGLGAGMLQVSTIYLVSETVPKEAITLGIAISMAAVSLGLTLSPVIINPLKTFFFGAEATSANAFLIASISCVILSGCEFLRNILLEKDSKIGEKLPPKEPAVSETPEEI